MPDPAEVCEWHRIIRASVRECPTHPNPVSRQVPWRMEASMHSIIRLHLGVARPSAPVR